MKIAVASDHGGVNLKASIVSYLQQEKNEVLDLGTNGGESVDYPDFALKVAEMVSKGQVEAGILLCGTGIGMCIAANKFRGVRAAVASDPFSARMAKEHNDANILCVGGRISDPQKAQALVAAWITAQFGGGRHQRRLDKIAAIEARTMK